MARKGLSNKKRFEVFKRDTMEKIYERHHKVCKHWILER